MIFENTLKYIVLSFLKIPLKQDDFKKNTSIEIICKMNHLNVDLDMAAIEKLKA